MFKVCTSCKINKSSDDFTKDTKRKDGLNVYCKVCTRLKVKVSSIKNSENLKLSRAKWYQANKQHKNKKSKEWRLLNLDKSKNYQKKWRSENRDKTASYDKKWYEANRKYKSEYYKNRRLLNIETFLIKERENSIKNWQTRKIKEKRWRDNNPHLVTFYAAMRRAAIRKRTPNWLTSKDYKLIMDFYKMAKSISKSSGVDYHVDHIIPLRGKLVSGLNVPNNLQILPSIENLRKTNKYET